MGGSGHRGARVRRWRVHGEEQLWLRGLAWLLFGLALGVSVVLAGFGLIDASTVQRAGLAALSLLLAAAVGVAGGEIAGAVCHAVRRRSSAAAAPLPSPANTRNPHNTTEVA